MDDAKTHTGCTFNAGESGPEEVFALLREGASCEVDGFRLNPDKDGVWITDPHGIDCGLWQEVTLGKVEEFLERLATANRESVHDNV